MKESNKKIAITPNSSTSLVRVDNSISITDKILKEHNFKLHNHKTLLMENWNNIFPDEWKEILELHIILSKLGINVDTKCSIHHQYKSLFGVDYTYNDKTDLNHLKSLKTLNLRTKIEINDLSPISFFENLIEFQYWNESDSIVGIEKIGGFLKLEYLHIYAPKVLNLNFLINNLKLKKLTLITGDIIDYTFLKKLEGLEYLYFSTDKLTKHHPIFTLLNLKTLTVMNCNQVEDIDQFINLSNLEELTLYYVNITNINFLKRLEIKSLRIRNGGLKNEEIDWIKNNIPDLILL